MTGSRRVGLAATVGLLLIAGSPGPELLAQQDDAVPAWVLQELAAQAARDGEFARALQLYSDALAEDPSLPEALVGSGRVHDAQGDLALAIRYYTDALELASAFRVPEDVIVVHLELDELYDRRGRPGDVGRRLGLLDDLVMGNPAYADARPGAQRAAMRDLLLTPGARGGIDRVLILYRLDQPQTVEAHRRYATLLDEQGDTVARLAALDNRLFVVVQLASRAIEAMIDDRFDYEFSTVTGFLADVEDHAAVRSYLVQMRFRDALFDLSESLDSIPGTIAAQRAQEVRALAFLAPG